MSSQSPSFAQTDADASRWLAQARGGDMEAFGEVCRAYGNGLLCQALALCGNHALAEDLAEETLVEAWKCLHRYNGRCRFFTWLCAILLNRYRNTLRQKRPWSLSSFMRAAGEEPEDGALQRADTQAQPDQAAESRERAALVRRCIQALPPKHRQVIYLRYYVDDSLEGIAQAVGCSIGTVKSRLFHALDKLSGMKDLEKL